jgi:hypothetical protein
MLVIASIGAPACYKSYPRTSEDAEADSALPDFNIDPGTDEWAECHDREFDVSQGRPDVLILLDRSNSMCPDVGPEYLRHAKDAIRGIVEEWQNQIAFGYTYFPSRLCVPMSSFICTPTTSMHVEVEPGNASAIMDALDATDCCGGTPIAESLDYTRRYYEGLADGRAHHVLLVTDGAPNCNAGLNRMTCVCTYNPDEGCVDDTDSLNCLDDVRTVEAAAALFAAGMPVHVLGLAEAAIEWSWVMDEIALAGGTEEAVLAEEAEAIAEAMNVVAGDVAPCRFELIPGEVADPEAVYFLVDGVEVDRDPRHEDGWDWVNAWTVDFYGPACDRIVEGGALVVTARINCDAP